MPENHEVVETPEPLVQERVFSPVLPPLDLDGRGSKHIDLAEIDWKPVSSRYVKVRLGERIIWTLVLVGACLVPLIFTAGEGFSFLPGWSLWALAGVMLVQQIWLTVLVTRQVKAIGYSERQDHIISTRGLMFRSVRAIPYGRIQYLDVKSGPLENMMKLASLHVKTAAGDLTIQGLERSEAERLREVLTDLSDAKMVGL